MHSTNKENDGPGNRITTKSPCPVLCSKGSKVGINSKIWQICTGLVTTSKVHAVCNR